MLSASFTKTVNQPGRYGDGRGGHGLSLLVRETANGRLSKTWAQRLRIGGKPVNIGLGGYPVVALAEAREKALENRRAVAQGRDPRGGGVPTFEEAVEKVIALHSQQWREGGKTEDQWRSSLAAYAYPMIGRKRVDLITTADVMSVLMPIWHEKAETARRVRRRLASVMTWCIAQGHRADNPAGEAVIAALPKNERPPKHFAALPHEQVGEALRTIRSSDTYPLVKAALQFLVMTATRAGEVRGATWDEFDLEQRLWVIPSTRMKTRKQHRVPLSTQAVALLEGARGPADDTALAFSTMTGLKIDDGVFPKLLKALGIPATAHGMRTSFRSWCAEQGVSREVAEMSLAHIVGGVEGAYQRSDLLDARREVMQLWANYLTGAGTHLDSADHEREEIQ